MSTATELAEQFFTSVAAADGEALVDLCTADARISQNGAAELTIPELAARLSAIASIVQGNRYEDVQRQQTEDGFVEEHTAAGTLPNGEEIRIRSCVVATVKDGKIAGLREYVDSAAFAPVRAALAG
jgi:ketosteroid isomerase-like protein